VKQEGLLTSFALDLYDPDRTNKAHKQ